MFQFVFSIDPFTEAKTLSEKGKYAEAIKVYMRVKQLYPDTEWVPRSILQVALNYEKMNKYDDAIAEYKTLIEKYSTLHVAEEAYFAIGRIRTTQNMAVQAVKAYELYLRNYPKGEFAVMAYFNEAAIYKQTGNKDEALRCFNEILNNYQNELWFHSWAAIYSGDIYSGRKDYDRAIAKYQKVTDSDKNKVLYSLSLLHLAQANMEKNDFISAKNAFNELTHKDNFFQEEALYGLGKSYYKLGEYKLAKDVYTSLLQMFPETIWRKNVEKGLKLMDKKINKQRTEANEEL
ncbi:MAG: tetratricopeptide repeat protein [bacterium]